MKDKIISDHILILYFSILTFFFNLYLLYLPCIPIYPDKLILIATLLISLSLLILIPFKIERYKKIKTPHLVRDILNISHWGYLLIIPIGILLARAMPTVVLITCIAWFALISRAIYYKCPLSSIAEKDVEIDTTEDIVNVYFVICACIGCIRLFIN